MWRSTSLGKDIPILKYFIIIILFNYVAATRRFDVQWTQTNCTAIDAHYVDSFTCNIVQLPKGRGNYITAQLIFAQDIAQMSYDFRVLTPRLDGAGSIEYFRIKKAGCHLAEFNSKNSYLNAVLKKMLQSSNFPRSCPLKRNVSYGIQHYSLNADHFPPFTPDMRFTLTVQMNSAQKTPMLLASVSAAVAKKAQQS